MLVECKSSRNNQATINWPRVPICKNIEKITLRWFTINKYDEQHKFVNFKPTFRKPHLYKLGIMFVK